MYRIIDGILAWENGEMRPDDEVEFFQHFLDSGTIYSLQGMYQRRMQELIDLGYVTQKHVGGDPS